MDTSFFSSNIFGKSPLEMALSGGSGTYVYAQPSSDVSAQIAQAIAANQQMQPQTDLAAYALANPTVVSRTPDASGAGSGTRVQIAGPGGVWQAGPTRDLVTWVNNKTGESWQGSSTSVPPSSDWAISGRGGKGQSQQVSYAGGSADFDESNPFATGQPPGTGQVNPNWFDNSRNPVVSGSPGFSNDNPLAGSPGFASDNPLAGSPGFAGDNLLAGFEPWIQGGGGQVGSSVGGKLPGVVTTQTGGIPDSWLRSGAAGQDAGSVRGALATATGAGGTQFPFTSQQMAQMANQAAMQNPNLGASTQAVGQVVAGTAGSSADKYVGGYGPGRDPITGRTPQEEQEFQALVKASKTSDRMTADQRAKLKQQFPGMTWADEEAKAATTTQAAQTSQQAASNLTTKPQYGANIQFNQFGNWGPVTGSLEDRIFRQFGDLTGRYTSQQVTPDEVKAIADKVRAGTLKEADVGSAITAAEAARKAAASTQSTQQKQPTQVESYFKNPMTDAQINELANKATYKVADNQILSGQLGLKLDDRGQPGEFVYYDPKGTQLTMSAFSPAQFLKYANEFNIKPTDLLGLEKGLAANKIGYKPYEYFSGTGSDLGFDIRDFLRGGMGTAYDWTKDPNAAQKGPTGLSSLKEAQDIASKFGLKYNEDKYKGGGIDPAFMSQLQGGGNAPRGYAMLSSGNNIAAWYNTKEEAEAAAKQYGGKVMDLTGGSVVSQDNRNNLTKDSNGNWVLKPGGATGGLFDSGSFKSPLVESLKNLPARMPGLSAVR